MTPRPLGFDETFVLPEASGYLPHIIRLVPVIGKYLFPRAPSSVQPKYIPGVRIPSGIDNPWPILLDPQLIADDIVRALQHKLIGKIQAAYYYDYDLGTYVDIMHLSPTAIPVMGQAPFWTVPDLNPLAKRLTLSDATQQSLRPWFAGSAAFVISLSESAMTAEDWALDIVIFVGTLPYDAYGLLRYGGDHDPKNPLIGHIKDENAKGTPWYEITGKLGLEMGKGIVMIPVRYVHALAEGDGDESLRAALDFYTIVEGAPGAVSKVKTAGKITIVVVRSIPTILAKSGKALRFFARGGKYFIGEVVEQLPKTIGPNSGLLLSDAGFLKILAEDVPQWLIEGFRKALQDEKHLLPDETVTKLKQAGATSEEIAV